MNNEPLISNSQRLKVKRIISSEKEKSSSFKSNFDDFQKPEEQNKISRDKLLTSKQQIQSSFSVQFYEHKYFQWGLSFISILTWLALVSFLLKWIFTFYWKLIVEMINLIIWFYSKINFFLKTASKAILNILKEKN